MEADVAVQFGFGILKGDALTAPEHGVLSYHHGDLTAYRGRPPGFYEFLHRKSTEGVTVQQLTESLDAGAIAASTTVDIEDAISWREVKSRLFAASPELLSRAVDNLIEGSIRTPESLGDLYTTPSNTQTLAYIWEGFDGRQSLGWHTNIIGTGQTAVSNDINRRSRTALIGE